MLQGIGTRTTARRLTAQAAKAYTAQFRSNDSSTSARRLTALTCDIFRRQSPSSTSAVYPLCTGRPRHPVSVWLMQLPSWPSSSERRRRGRHRRRPPDRTSGSAGSRWSALSASSVQCSVCRLKRRGRRFESRYGKMFYRIVTKVKVG